MLDIDHFKHYNDTYGHTAGDMVLISLSQNLTKFLKEYNPIIGRFGGEEFCVILPGCEKKRADVVAKQLLQAIHQEKIILRRQETHVSASIGVAEFPADAKDENTIILKADRALYNAKAKGRNRVCLA